jgi:outer membrane immunogenic protein
MKKILWSAVSATAFLMFSLAAQAADLPARPPPAYQPPVAVPLYNWTGFYFGINGGYGSGKQDPLALLTDNFDSYGYTISGGFVGGTFGAQIQSGHVLLGLEADIDWASIKGSSTFIGNIGNPGIPVTLGLNTEVSSVSTARLRIGWAQDNWLFYGTGGLAFMGTKAHTTIVSGAVVCDAVELRRCSISPLKAGVAAGAGIEWGFASNWSAKLEYLYIAQIDGLNTNNLNTVRAGVNMRFGGN